MSEYIWEKSQEEKIKDEQPTKISQLENDVGYITKKDSIDMLNVIDSRNENYPPSYYFELGRKEVNEFKRIASIDNPPVKVSAVYVFIKTITGWADPSGGYPVQLAYGTEGIALRTGMYNDIWSPWVKINETKWENILNRPTSMPANGGNADTVGGKDVNQLLPMHRLEFRVEGDANTYYPILVEGVVGSDFFGKQLLYIYRNYNDPAPDTWNTSTHRGGLDLDIELFLKGWGGNSYYMDILFGQTYSRILADLIVPNPRTSDLIIWLRGGGALYRIQTTAPSTVVTPTIGDLIYMPGSQYETIHKPRTTVEAVFDFANGWERRKFECGYKVYRTPSFRYPKDAILIT